MEYHCSACHAAFAADEEPEACPRCHAEAGLERKVGHALPIKLFAGLLGGVMVAAVAGGLFARFAG